MANNRRGFSGDDFDDILGGVSRCTISNDKENDHHCQQQHTPGTSIFGNRLPAITNNSFDSSSGRGLVTFRPEASGGNRRTNRCHGNHLDLVLQGDQPIRSWITPTSNVHSSPPINPSVQPKFSSPTTVNQRPLRLTLNERKFTAEQLAFVAMVYLHAPNFNPTYTWAYNQLKSKFPSCPTDQSETTAFLVKLKKNQVRAGYFLSEARNYPWWDGSEEADARGRERPRTIERFHGR